MFNFMGLPREFRDEIYKLCLTVDAEIVAHPTCFEQATDFDEEGVNRPAVALLSVSKQVGNEAKNVLYGENVWRVPDPQREDLGGLDSQIYWKNCERFRHITVHLDRRDATEIPREMLHQIHADPGSWYTVGPPQTVFDTIHRVQVGELRSYIQARRYYLADHMINIRSLTLAVDELFCPIGCCRLGILEFVFHQARGWNIMSKPSIALSFPRLENIRVTGLRTDEERRIVKEAWGIDP